MNILPDKGRHAMPRIHSSNSGSTLIIVPSATGSHGTMFSAQQLGDNTSISHLALCDIEAFLGAILNNAGAQAALLRTIWCVDANGLPGAGAKNVMAVKLAANILSSVSGSRLISINQSDVKRMMANKNVPLHDAAAVAAELERQRRSGLLPGEVVRRVQKMRIKEMAMLRQYVAASTAPSSAQLQ
jgi:hypothetical protein